MALACCDYLLLRACDWTTSFQMVWHQHLLNILSCGRTVLVMNVPAVGCAPPVKGLGATNTTADIYICTAFPAVCLLIMLLLLLLRLKIYVQQRECSRKQTMYQWFSMSPPTLISEAESNPLFFRAKSATFNAPSTDTALGQDPDMRHSVPTAPLLAPQPKARERALARHRVTCLKKETMYTRYYRTTYRVQIYPSLSVPDRYIPGLSELPLTWEPPPLIYLPNISSGSVSSILLLAILCFIFFTFFFRFVYVRVLRGRHHERMRHRLGSCTPGLSELPLGNRLF